MRSIRAFSLFDCSVGDVTVVDLEALDDAAPAASSFVEVEADRPVDLPGLPASTRALVAHGRDADGAQVALGVLEVRDGEASGVLFRKGAACGLPGSGASVQSLPALVRPAVAWSDHGALLAGGRDDEGHARADAVLLDARKVQVVRLGEGLLRRRAGAAVLALDRAYVVAGGESDGRVWDDAESLDPSVSPPSFDRERLLHLSEPRAEAGAVVLASGDGLLVGGRSDKGPLASLEVVDGRTLTARVVGLASLSRARVRPRAFRLATGEVAVLGGVDGASAAVADVEVLDASAARLLRTIPLPPADSVDGVALNSGALLVVREERATKRNVPYLVRPDGGVDALPALPAGRLPPRLLPGSDGTPFLWDGAYHRFDPWSARTVDDHELPSAQLVPLDETAPFPLGAGVLAVVRAADRGFVSFAASRYDTRTELASEREVLGLGSTLHIVADRFVPAMATSLGLELPAGTRVAITDASYASLALTLSLRDPGAPMVELRSPEGILAALVGGAACPMPVLAGASDVKVTRALDGSIEVRAGDAAPTTCAPVAPAARVRVTVVAPAGGARLRGLRVSR